MQVLITGGAGFIGSRLAAGLVGDGHDVVVFDSLHPQVHHGPPIQLPDGVSYYAADVTDAEAWDRYFRIYGAPERVAHLAAETGTGQSLREASRHGEVNVVGTTQMTDAFVRHGCVPEQILLTSSRAVYGEGAWHSDADGTFYPPPRSGADLDNARWDPPSPSGGLAAPLPHAARTVWARPANVYAATKLGQEHILDSWCSAFGTSLSVLRLQNVYGPGQAVGNSYTGVLTFFARQIALGEPVAVYEDGNIIRDFVFVDDVVRALIGAFGRAVPGTQRCDVGWGEPVSLLEVAQTLCELANVAPPAITGQYRLGDVRAAFADITEARDLLDWKPEVDLRTGLRALMDWVPGQLG